MTHDPGYTPVNHVWIGDQYGTITGYRSGSAQVPGSYVCKYGQTTGYTCTTVISNTYVPTRPPSPRGGDVCACG